MALLIDPSLALVGLTLCLSLVGWVWAYGAGRRLGQLAAPASHPPRQVGPYTLMGKLGEGAMGEVYRAWNVAAGGWRAVKLLSRDASERDRQRFEQEARLGAELCHPNTVSIYDSGEARDGTCYYAMELLEGLTLHELVEREGRQDPERVVSILLELCAALGEAHGKGLVHRDIKPENVLLTRDGSCKLIDFGLAERVTEVARSRADAVVGTPLYISPEAIVAPETVGARSDLYGLGALAYFLLRGAPVFHGRSVVEVCGHHLHTAPERLSDALGGAIPAELERIVLQCLAKDPAQRPASAAELARRLASCLLAPAPGRAVPGSPRRARPQPGGPRRARDLRAAQRLGADRFMAAALADTLAVEARRPGDAGDGAAAPPASGWGQMPAVCGEPPCLAEIRSQRAFERLDAVLAAEARRAACSAAA